MTDELFRCPADAADGSDRCGRYFASENGAAMHAINKRDGHHSAIVSKSEAYAHMESVAVGSDPAPMGIGDVGDVDRDPDDGPRDPGPRDGGLVALDPAEAIPERDRSTEPETADCPECGADLGVTEAEVRKAIARHGGAWCGECGVEVEAYRDTERADE